MTFSQSDAQIYIPSGQPVAEAMAHVTHLAVGAHPDDLEFMAGHGILQGQLGNGHGFAGVTVASGSEEIAYRDIRRHEQQAAARVGGYQAVITLNHPSADLKMGRHGELIADLRGIFSQLRPQVIYTHNPTDKHDTHVAVCLAVVEALRQTPPENHPRRLLGCEVWRGLDWMLDTEKVLLDVSSGEDFLMKLMGVYKSQLAEKAYDKATLGRKRANATYLEAYAGDRLQLCEYAMDLSSLLKDPRVTLADLAQKHLDAFRGDVLARLQRVATK